MSLFLIFLLTLPFWITGEDVSKGCALAAILTILIPVALIVLWLLAVILCGFLMGAATLAEWIGNLF